MGRKCAICEEEYDPAGRCPKITDCGHTACLECLEKWVKNGGTCPLCRKKLSKTPKNMITNHELLSDDFNDQSDGLWCEDCKKVAVTQCQLQAHLVRNLMPFLQNKIQAPLADLKSYETDLENAARHILSMQDISRDLLNDVMAEGDQCKMLSEHLKTFVKKGMVDKVNSAVSQAQELTKGKHLLERGLQPGNVLKGTLTLQLQSCNGGGEGDEVSHVVKLDFRDLAVGSSKGSPQILASVQLLMHVLSIHGHLQLQSTQGRLLTERGARGKTNGGPTTPKPKTQGAFRAPIPNKGTHNISSRVAATAASPVQSPVEITNDGVLDLGPPNSIGASCYGEFRAEKEALLRNSRMVRELKGLECAADPDFSKRLLEKHCSNLESVDLRKVQADHFNLLSCMPQIKNLKIVGYDGLLADFPPQPAGRALKSLYVHLPFKVQLSLWRAFAPSLQTVTLRIEVEGVLNVHLAVKPCADASPKLNSLQLHRKDPNKHRKEECDKQITHVRRVVKTSVIVTCNICRHSP
ncbi:putative RING finger protein [Frankliniella fusca]|uniref:RING finger protein n=1 Tax=Frankliniella fusca TaxID=407009 RepID=A0AAE1LWJ7_9NEOP|nr:putative RING finger protein [Frankliniella fusca]